MLIWYSKTIKNRRDLCRVFNDQDNEVDNDQLANSESITLNRNLLLDDGAIKKICWWWIKQKYCS